MTDKLKAALYGEYPPAIYRLATTLDAAQIARSVQQCGYDFFDLDGERIVDKRSFLQAFADALAFPRYFGRNWDALDECLTDLSWLPARGRVVLYDQVARFAAAQAGAWDVALAVLEAAVEYWKPTATPLFVVLRGADTIAPELPTL